MGLVRFMKAHDAKICKTLSEKKLILMKCARILEILSSVKLQKSLKKFPIWKLVKSPIPATLLSSNPSEAKINNIF